MSLPYLSTEVYHILVELLPQVEKAAQRAVNLSRLHATPEVRNAEKNTCNGETTKPSTNQCTCVRFVHVH